MPKTKKSLILRDLLSYDVYIEDTAPNSEYFQVTNLPPAFSGGRNSFLINGSPFLKVGSRVLIEIQDSEGNPVFQNPVQKYVEGTSRMISVEIPDTVSSGFGIITLLGEVATTLYGDSIPKKWENVYNVRWVKKILMEPNKINTSPILLLDEPTVFSEEKKFFSITSASYTNFSIPFTASLTPTKLSSFQVGYLINAVAPTSFSADIYGGYITGSILVNNSSASVYLPITNILNSTTAFSSGELITIENGTIVDQLYLTSGSYNTRLFNTTGSVTGSVKLNYSTLNTPSVNLPVSYAKLRIVNMNTVSGEIFKLKVHSKVASNISDYKLIAEVPVTTEELLVTSSIRGELPIGDFNLSNTASVNWYSDVLTLTTNPVYPISGSIAYYNSTTTVTPFTLVIDDSVLLRSVYSNVPKTAIVPETLLDSFTTASKFNGTVSESGYFIGNKNPITLFASSEYTFELDAYFRQTSGSLTLVGKQPQVDIYIISVAPGSKVVSSDPLGQKIGTLTVLPGEANKWFQNQQFNFNPSSAVIGDTLGFGIRLVVTNGFWQFSNISLKPASDKVFSPDETQILVPNTEYSTEMLQHKIEFFDINSNSTDLAVYSTPTYFSGSVQ